VLYLLVQLLITLPLYSYYNTNPTLGRGGGGAKKGQYSDFFLLRLPEHLFLTRHSSSRHRDALQSSEIVTRLLTGWLRQILIISYRIKCVLSTI